MSDLSATCIPNCIQRAERNAVKLAQAAQRENPDNPTVDSLIKKLDSRNPRDREEAAKAIGKLGKPDPKFVFPLNGLAIGDRMPSVREAAIEAAHATGSVVLLNTRIEEILISIIQIQGIEYGHDRGKAAEAMGNYGYSLRFEKPLYKALKDDEPFVRAKAAEAVAKLKLDTEKIQKRLFDLLEDLSPFVCGKAAEAIGNLGLKKIQERLIALLKDKNSFFRQKTAEALGKIGDKEVLPPLRKLFEDIDPRVKEAAQKANEEIEKRIKQKSKFKTLPLDTAQ